MNPFRFFNYLKREDHKPRFGGLDLFKYIGPGLLVTVGFIDPGNWAANLAAGSGYGYTLLWVISLSTIMLIFLQHNVAHLGIATGLCLSEAATIYIKPSISRFVLGFAIMASVATSLAEILGGSIALNMLFKIPLKTGAILITAFVAIMLLSNSYKKIEKWIIGFVSIIGLSFLYELYLIDVDWIKAGTAWVTPTIPQGAILLVMSILGAVVMPHNLFLHSEIIQSRQWNLQDDKIIRKQLKFEFTDTLLSMFVGWAINSAMIILAAVAFFSTNTKVDELQQANSLLRPLLGGSAAIVFAIALLLSGVASSITSAMAGGSIFAGMYKEPFDIKDSHTRTGVAISLVGALVLLFLVKDPFKGLIWSQVFLSIQLPFTVFVQLYLTSSKRVMGKYVNTIFTTAVLTIIAIIIAFLNIRFFIEMILNL